MNKQEIIDNFSERLFLKRYFEIDDTYLKNSTAIFLDENINGSITKPTLCLWRKLIENEKNLKIIIKDEKEENRIIGCAIISFENKKLHVRGLAVDNEYRKSKSLILMTREIFKEFENYESIICETINKRLREVLIKRYKFRETGDDKMQLIKK